MSLSPPSTFLCVSGSCTVVDKNAHTIGAIQLGINIKVLEKKFFDWASIGRDTIFPLSLRQSGIEFSLVSDYAKLGSA